VAAEQRPGGRQPRHLALLGAVAALAYAVGAAGTTAFTKPADVLTVLPIIGLAVLVVIRWPLRPRPRPRRVGADGTHPFRAWVLLFAAIVLWELADYAARGSRADHPTLSSMFDAVDRFFVLKTLMFFAWLCLGAAILRKGTPAPTPAPTSATTPEPAPRQEPTPSP
jgi:hypothetical protein